MKNLYKCFLICFALFVMWFMEDINARAIDYSDACGEEINGYNEVLHRCGTNYIYVGEDRHKSSFFTSSIFFILAHKYPTSPVVNSFFFSGCGVLTPSSTTS